MDEIDEIKRKIDIVELMSQYLTMKKAGANYKALCPFHQEKTPSMMISPERQIFKCFGCLEGGDVFAFIMKMEGLEFVEALKMLADRAGVILKSNHKSKQEYQQEKDTKSQLYKINLLSAQVYHKILMESKSAEKAREYLKSRKLEAISLKKFQIGYAPNSSILSDFLRKRGFTYNEIKTAGNPDRFHDRIIFPIMDVMGNVVGFTGRTLDPKLEPKYLNTPESPIFHKSRVLYGLDKAKAEIKVQKQSIIVEGQMDVVLSHQAGIGNAVASSGTAMTLDHLQILNRYSSNIVFAFDADSAGTKAAKKAIEMAIETEINSRIIVLPEGIKDAGEAIEKDPKIWQDAVKKSVPMMDWIINFQLSTFNNKQMSGQDKKQIAKEILPVIKKIPDQIEQSHYIQVLAKRLQVQERMIREVMGKIQDSRYLPTGQAGKIQDTNNIATEEKKLSLEENFVGLLIAYPKFIKSVIIDLDYKYFEDSLFAGEVYKHLQSCYTIDSCDKEICLGKGCKNFLKGIFDKDLSQKISFLVMQVEKNHADSPEDEIKQEILDSAQRIKDQKKENVKDDFAKKIQNAEASGNREEVKKLLEEFQRIIK